MEVQSHIDQLPIYIFCIKDLDIKDNASIYALMSIERDSKASARWGLLNLILIAAEDAGTIASSSRRSDQSKAALDEDISMLRELGYRIAILAEAVEAIHEQAP